MAVSETLKMLTYLQVASHEDSFITNICILHLFADFAYFARTASPHHCVPDTCISSLKYHRFAPQTADRFENNAGFTANAKHRVLYSFKISSRKFPKVAHSQHFGHSRWLARICVYFFLLKKPNLWNFYCTQSFTKLVDKCN